MKTVSAFVILALVVLALPAGAVQAQSLTYDSCIQVQNLSATEASIIVYYYEQNNTTAVASPTSTVPANGKRNFCPLSAVSDGFNGSVVIESTEPVAAIVNVTAGAWNAYTASYAGFDAGATTVNIPLLFKNNYGYNTWFNVQNVGTGVADVDIAYSDGTTSLNNAVNQYLSKTFDQSLESHTQAVFAATVTSDQPIVVTVMEVGPTTSPMLFGYNGFTAGHANPVMPLVQANNFGFTTGIGMQNTGASETSVTVSFVPSGVNGTACSQTKTIAAGASSTFALTAWGAADANTDNNCVNGETFVGSARVTANSAGNGLVAIVNQQNFGTFMGASYGSFSPDSATAKVVMPLVVQGNYGYFTGFNVMNVGASATDVNCTFSNSTFTVSQAGLQPGAAMTKVQFNTALGDGYVGSAVCTATGGDQKIIGVVNYQKLGTNQDTFMVYEAFNAVP